jgi:serine/threonine protein kinase
VWSFGITLLELINGLPPHRYALIVLLLGSCCLDARNCSARAMFVAATRGYPVLPLSKRLRWSAELTDFLHNCLAFDPLTRWSAEKYASLLLYRMNLTIRLLSHKFLKSLPSKKEMVDLVFSS